MSCQGSEMLYNLLHWRACVWHPNDLLIVAESFMLKPDKFFMEKGFRITGCHQFRCHTILLAARHKRVHFTLTPASEGWYSIYLPGEMEGWVDLGAMLGASAENRIHDRLLIESPTLSPPRQPFHVVFVQVVSPILGLESVTSMSTTTESILP